MRCAFASFSLSCYTGFGLQPQISILLQPIPKIIQLFSNIGFNLLEVFLRQFFVFWLALCKQVILYLWFGA